MFPLCRELYIAGVAVGLLNIFVGAVIQITGSTGLFPISYILGGYILGLMSMMFVTNVNSKETALAR